jgi:hypothetical protein
MSDEKPKSLKKKIVYSVLALLVVGGLVSNLMESREAEKMAAEGGFENVQEFEAAKAKNIFTKAEYDDFIAERDRADKAAAEQGGFLNVDEYKKAQYVNMPTKALYDEYLVQQAELKLAEEKRKAEEAEKARLAKAAEEKRKAEEAEKARLAAIADEKRKAEEAENARLAAIADEKRKAEEAENARLAAIAEEKRKADEAEKVRLAALTPSLTMKCENQKGWLVYIMHLNKQATVIKPVENPVDGYHAVAENVTIKNYGNPEYWYSPEDLNKGFNITKTSYWRGFTQAKLDLRKTTLGKSKEPYFTIFSDVYNTFKKEWETSYSGKYICSNISLAAFNAVLLNNKK